MWVLEMGGRCVQNREECAMRKSAVALLILGYLCWCAGCGGGSGGGGGGESSSSTPSTPLTTNEWTWISGSSTVVEQNGAFVGMPGVYGTLGTPTTGNVPGGRNHAVTWSDERGNLWLFGGSGLDSTGTAGWLNDLWEFNPSTREWAWMGGSSTLTDEGQGFYGTPGVYGTLGTAAAGNVPGGRYSATSWTDSSGNFWLFGGQGFDSTGPNGLNNLGYLNDLWEFNPSTGEWAWMGGSSTVGFYYSGPPGVYGTLGTPAPGNVPGGRSDASSWTDRSGNLWLFGGIGIGSTAPPYGGGKWLNDLWEFNPSTREWAWMSGGSTGQSAVYGALGTPAPGNVPGARSDASSWTDRSGNLWLFGGNGSDSTGTWGYLNDLWEFSPSTREWAWMGGSSKVGQSGVYGTLGTPAAVNVPGARESASSWTDSSGNFWLFGGDTGSAQGPVFNDLWEFNPSTKEWAWMSGSSTIDLAGVYGTLGTPAPGNVPGGRTAASTWTDSRGNLWLFGGYGADSSGKLTYLNDLWEYQF